MNIEDITIGEEYQYLDNFVKVLEIWPDNQTAVIETRFAEQTTCNIIELTPKPPKPRTKP